ncbi:MAG: acetate kinase [Spirochaetes bacterium]|nr:acetate kinase [Spirochaetota bacterium]
MYVLVFNCGSSSVRYQLIDSETKKAKCSGLLERIGLPKSVLTHRVNGEKHIFENDVENHDTAVKMILDTLTDSSIGAISSLDEIEAVGHRVVHGGEKYSTAVLIDKEAEKNIEECIPLAPLHNPANLMGIRACDKFMPSIPQAAVFDTAFHQTMPECSYMYAIPHEFYDKYRIRRYGFHGTSHRYVSRRAAQLYGREPEDLKIITCHMGNGASIAAIKNGKVIDTSMGFTPLAGLIMGTRSGDIDPSIIPFIMKNEGVDADFIDTMLNKKSGVLGITGISSDMRDIENAAWNLKDKKAQLALDMYHYRIIQYIGAYTAAMNGVDLIVFTGGVGENGWETREEILKNLTYLGINPDKEKNRCRGKETVISAPGSAVTVMVVPTNEELEIAEECLNLVAGRRK